MKTPRELLLERHRAAEPRLDAIRRAVVAKEFNNNGTKEQSGDLVALFRGCLNTPWRELILPNRRIWTGLAALWLLIFIFNISQRDTVNSVTGQPVLSSAVTISWQVQQRWMNELLTDRTMTPDMDRPRNEVTKPRTERSRTTNV